MNEHLGKSYSLCSKIIIDKFFDKKQSQFVQKYPFRLYYQVAELNSNTPFQIVFSVPKRRIKSAPKRNKVKRRMREVIRKNKGLIEPTIQDKKIQLALFLVYNNNEIVEFKEFEHKIVVILERLNREIKEKL